MKAEGIAALLHTREVRGSSPCAPTIVFKALRGFVSTNSGLLLFRHVVPEDLREQVLRLLHFSSATLIDTSGSSTSTFPLPSNFYFCGNIIFKPVRGYQYLSLVVLGGTKRICVFIERLFPLIELFQAVC